MLLKLLAISSITLAFQGDEHNDETVLFYYGLEESERGLPWCGASQVCSALLPRYWRPRALLRLCRCARRQRCDTVAPQQRLLELNNRAHLQFCKPVSEIAECAYNDTALIVDTHQERMNPDEIEMMHHNNVHLAPPKIILNCRCRLPNYWKLKSHENTMFSYQCSSLPLCKTGDFCGHVDNDFFALYQSCLCPKRHICVHDGGVPHTIISELMYRGRGWKAHCRMSTYNSSDQDYDYS
ncbi:uncharacterized protein LOC126965100 [Leptidea sinapis]|uniref:uncharacterized protein LOC126965100 n=1 Tax=Leptidea sinapis TaxID=189913 RepID=UPI00212DA838|nr:uncharacterized protein LOC126965100 [Leptidea sinapis]